MAEIFGFSHVPIKSMRNTVYNIVSLSKEHDQIKFRKFASEDFLPRDTCELKYLSEAHLRFSVRYTARACPSSSSQLQISFLTIIFIQNLIHQLMIFLLFIVKKLISFCFFLKNATFLAATSFQRMQSPLHFFNMISIRSFLKFLTNLLIFLLFMNET